MTDDMTKRRDELAVKQYNDGNFKIAYCKGFDAGVADMQAQVDVAVNELNELKEFTASILEDMNHYFDNKCIPTLDEVNQCAIAYNQVEKTIEQIQKMRGVPSGTIDRKESE